MTLTLGALCAGYGGLDEAVMEVLGAELKWYSEYDKAPARIMEHHHPGKPNLWDLTKIVWADVPPVDIITAGFPCQPFSHAGKQLGANDERHLWPYIAEAVRVIRPRLVVLENVRGLLSGQGEPDTDDIAALVDQARRWQAVIHHVIDPKLRKARNRGQQDRITRLEADAIRLTEQRRRALDAVRRERRRLVRAIGAVLRDLANLGYDARWYGLRAADVGAAHGRFRVFVIAAPGDADVAALEGRRPGGRGAGERPARADGVGAGTGGLSLLPTPTSSDTNGPGAHGDGGLDLRTAVGALLPTPAVNDMGAAYTPDEWDAWTDRMKAAHGNGNGHGKSLAIEAQRLLPTPEASRAGGTAEQHLARKLAADGSARTAVTNLDVLAASTTQDWRQYDAAIRRHEVALGRPAPPPTETGPKGKPRLSAAFVEWLMMLPAGHVTDPAIGLTRNEQLKALGNGVVPAQAAAALRAYIADETADNPPAQQRSA